MPSQDKKPRKSKGRQAILEAAEALFAEQGCRAVSLNQINQAANQKNTAALHYHFGSREALLDEITDQHLSEIQDELQLRLEQMKPPVSIRDFVACSVTPYLRKLDDVRGVRYLQIIAQLSSESTNLALIPRREDLRSLTLKLIGKQLGDLRPQSIYPRMIAYSLLLINELCLVSRMSPREIRQVFGGKKMFREHLITTLTTVLSPPEPGAD